MISLLEKKKAYTLCSCLQFERYEEKKGSADLICLL